MNTSYRQQAIALLSAPPSSEALLALITWLDVACSETPVTARPQQILARAVVAVGTAAQESHPSETIARTLHAAERFARAPTDDHFDAYQRAATDSYPFGPGDGCLAIPQTGYVGCAVGSGCRSGAGCLYYVDMLRAQMTMQVLAEHLLPWLQGADDQGELCHTLKV